MMVRIFEDKQQLVCQCQLLKCVFIATRLDSFIRFANITLTSQFNRFVSILL